MSDSEEKEGPFQVLINHNHHHLQGQESRLDVSRSDFTF